MSASKPVELKIPSVRVYAKPLLKLGLDDKHQFQAPPVDKADQAGWYTGGVTPGEKGVSVVLAHYATVKGPGLLWDAGRVKVGDPIEVKRADGRTARFVVQKIEQVRKEKVTARDVKLNSKHAELRLIVPGRSLVREGLPGAGRKNDVQKEKGDGGAVLRYNIVFYADLRK
ncbi:sortase [Streptomyces sp. NPDC001795]|uniref:sortase domain-containing protein n=1 Tax=Streptomyces sp. NPDC001795 TaxID=3154525 RepID=UPI003333355A